MPMAFLCILISRQNDYVKCEEVDNQGHNDENDKNNEGGKENLTYRLVMFDPASVVSGGSVNEVKEDVEEDVYYENDGNAEDGNPADGEQGEEVEEEEENATETFEPNVLPKRNHKHSTIVDQSEPDNKDEENRASLYQEIFKYKESSEDPYDFRLPDDFERELSKFENPKRLPTQIIKRKKPRKGNRDANEMDKEILNYFVKRAADNEQKKKKKRNKKLLTDKKDKFPRNSILQAKEESLQILNPNYYSEGSTHPKGITTRDLNLRIRSRNPMPLYVRHYKTFWPMSHPHAAMQTHAQIQPHAPMQPHTPMQPPAHQYPVINHKHLHEHGPQKTKKCKNNCKKKKKRKPKVKRGKIYRTRLSSSKANCRDEHRDDFQTFPEDSPTMYNSPSQVIGEPHTYDNPIYDAGYTPTQQIYQYPAPDIPSTNYGDSYYNPMIPDEISSHYGAEFHAPEVHVPEVHIPEVHVPEVHPDVTDDHPNTEDVANHQQEVVRELERPEELANEDGMDNEQEFDDEYDEEQAEETKTRKETVIMDEKGESKKVDEK